MTTALVKQWLTPKEGMSFLTHFVAWALVIPAAVVLLGEARDGTTSVGAAVYSLGLFVVYGGSTICHHGFSSSPRVQELLDRLDHAGIFVMIAATYTPLCLITLGDFQAGMLLVVVWELAGIGAYCKLKLPMMPRVLSSFLYVSMGSLILIWLPTLMERLPFLGLLLLLSGGVCYIVAAIIWALEWPNPHPWLQHHELMHLVVMMASMQHYLMIKWFVVASWRG